MIDETLALSPRDRNGDHGTIRVLHIKGDQSPIEGLHVGTWTAIGRRLDHPNEPEWKSRHSEFFLGSVVCLQLPYVRTESNSGRKDRNIRTG